MLHFKSRKMSATTCVKTHLAAGFTDIDLCVHRFDVSLLPHPCLLLYCVAFCRFETNRAMTRCSCCNAADFRLLTSLEAKEQVPKHVFEVRSFVLYSKACTNDMKQAAALELVQSNLDQLHTWRL